MQQDPEIVLGIQLMLYHPCPFEHPFQCSGLMGTECLLMAGMVLLSTGQENNTFIEDW